MARDSKAVLYETSGTKQFVKYESEYNCMQDVMLCLSGRALYKRESTSFCSSSFFFSAQVIHLAIPSPLYPPLTASFLYQKVLVTSARKTTSWNLL